VLEALFRRRGSPVSKEFLTNMDDQGASSEAVDTVMSRLRKRLRDVGATATIKTLKLTGFVLEAAAAPEAATSCAAYDRV
jgi:DNA-binding winged helix-turn-helix (wHTH) protein